MLLPLTVLGHLRMSLSYTSSFNGVCMRLYVDAVRLILHYIRVAVSLFLFRAYGLVACVVIFSCDIFAQRVRLLCIRLTCVGGKKKDVSIRANDSWVCFQFVSGCLTIKGSLCRDSSHNG